VQEKSKLEPSRLSSIDLTRPHGICVDDLHHLRQLGDQELASLGLLDVTAAPFFADSSGQTDSSAAIQAAVIFGREHKLAVFFPVGTYLISRSIACVAGWTEERTSRRRYLPHSEYWPCVLIGDRRDGKCPRLVLAEHSPGFQNPDAPRPMLDFYANDWVRPAHGAPPNPGRQGNVNFHQTLLGFELEIRPGNPGAACVSFDAAEGSSLQDCRFLIGDGRAGMTGGPGSGGILANCEFEGGAIGCLVDSPRPPGTYAGCRFRGQRDCAVLKNARANLTLVGCSFELPRGVHTARAAAIQRGSLSMIDCRISYEPGAKPTTAVLADTACYLRNVFVRDADVVVEATQHAAIAGGAGWRHMAELAAPYDYPGLATAPVYMDGNRSEEPMVQMLEEAPPENLCSRHIWEGKESPCWIQQDAVNVRDCGVVGDALHDDTTALQAAIDQYDTLFLPKGAYRISRTLQLRANTCLFGLSPAYSILAPLNAGDFADPDNPQPVIKTVDAAEARTRLAFFSVYMPRELAPGASMIDWACGGDSWMRCVFPSTGFVRLDFQPLFAGIMPWDNWRWDQIECALDQHAFHYTEPETDDLIAHEPVPDWPMARVHGHAGGGWYPFLALDGRRHGPRHRRILIEGVTGSFRIYQALLQYCRGKAEIEIRQSRGVAIYGIKNEKESVAAWINDSCEVLISGLSGTGQHNPEHKFLIENSEDVTIANTIDDCYAPAHESTHHRTHIRERRHGRPDIITQPYERPVVYRRTSSSAL
jgi:hypothetical protein